MQLNLPSQDNTWKQRHHSLCAKPWDGVPHSLRFRQSVDTPSPRDRRPRPLAYPSPNGTALSPTQQETLALQTQPENSRPGVQDSEAQEEIAPEDIKYRLEPLPKAPLPMQPPSYFSQDCKPQWLPFSTTYRERYKPWRMEPETYHREKPLHSGDLYMTTTHQISFQNPLLGQSMFPVHIQGRKIAPIVYPGYVECISQYQSDFQAPGWSQVLEPDPDRKSQGINKYIQTVQKDTAPGWQHTTHQHQKLSRPKQEITILGGKSTAKFDENTVTRGVQGAGNEKGFIPPGHPNPTFLGKSRNLTSPNLQPLTDSDISPTREVRHTFLSSQMSYLSPPKFLVKRVKGKCPSSTLKVFKAKFQTETTSKQFFQDCRTQPQVRHGDPHCRGYEKPLGMGSRAPAEDQTTTRTSYLPLFSERVNLCTPKVNSIKHEASDLSTEQRKTFRPVQLPESQLQKYSCQQQDSKLKKKKKIGRKTTQIPTQKCTVQDLSPNQLKFKTQVSRQPPYSLDSAFSQDFPATL